MIGEMFGRYRIVSRLGRGAMGTVFRALDPALERTVAIKTLDPELPADNMEELKERFLREAKSAGRLNHPNVVTIYDVGEVGKVAYIAMEYLEGRTLRQLLDARERLPMHTVTSIVAQIADALDYAQRFGIVHRDIKPANIMISPEGHAKLTDFGVAHLPASTMTQVGMVLGSPKYLSPEQVRGLPVDGRADIFALGVVLFEMLTGRTPFERAGINVYTLMQNICTEPVPRVTDVNPEVPAALDTIVARALGKHPDDRYQRAGEFANALRTYRHLAPAAADRTVLELSRSPAAFVAPRTGPAASDTLQPRHAGSDPEMDAEMARLLQDLDEFSRNLEVEERRLAESAQGRVAATRPGDVSGAARREGPGGHQPRGPLLNLLKGQATAGARQQPAKPSLESALALSGTLRQTFRYLVEFVRELNATMPAFAGTLNLPFVGKLPAVTLGGGFTDYRTKRVEDKEVVDYIVLTYRMAADERTRITLNKDEARGLKLHLERAHMTFEEREVGHAFHRMPRVALSLECSLVASARLRADYDALAVEILCQNVGLVGPARYRMAADRFNDEAVGEFGKLLLGLPSRFTELTLPE